MRLGTERAFKFSIMGLTLERAFNISLSDLAPQRSLSKFAQPEKGGRLMRADDQGYEGLPGRDECHVSSIHALSNNDSSLLAVCRNKVGFCSLGFWLGNGTERGYCMAFIHLCEV